MCSHWGACGGYSLQVTWRSRGLSEWVISRVISTLNGVTGTITLLITDLLSPLGLQVETPLTSFHSGKNSPLPPSQELQSPLKSLFTKP